MLLLVALVTGCGRAPRYDSRLSAADSIMQTAPDSALAIVQAVTPDSLATLGDRAYRDLLLTQARYKCYITATSDSDINRALTYYQQHSREREKLTRAYIYKGAVMEELGHPDSAMLYYKQAEATAAPDDYFNLGYSNLRIAELYQSFFANDSMVVYRMRRAAHYFTVIRDTGYLITAIGTQGGYPDILGQDSACLYLKKAIELGKKVNSNKRFQYQSKLAGISFYDGEYRKAKELAMDIVRNGSENCNENQFYYYAARSYLKLGLVDSAYHVKSLIPTPSRAVDSMNHHLFMSELCQSEHRLEECAKHSQKADSIQKRIMKVSLNTNLAVTELEWNVNHREKQLKYESSNRLEIIIGCSLLAILAIVLFGLHVFKGLSRRYNDKLVCAQQKLEKMIAEADEQMLLLTSEREKYKKSLDRKELELSKMSNQNRDLKTKQADVSRQISEVVRHRLSALKELNQSIRVKRDSIRGSAVPLLIVIKDLYDNNRMLQTTPTNSFWRELKLSVDEEYQGIASYVERSFPNLTKRDQHLFLLMCAGFPNQIIKVCMNYTNDVTASKRKKNLLSAKMGLNIKLDEFIDMYLEGDLNKIES
jgi:hypothetical protein